MSAKLRPRSQDSGQPTSQDVLELTLWCQRLATMVHRCSQPFQTMNDLEAVVRMQGSQLEALEKSTHHKFQIIEDRMQAVGVEHFLDEVEVDSYSSEGFNNKEPEVLVPPTADSFQAMPQLSMKEQRQKSAAAHGLAAAHSDDQSAGTSASRVRTQVSREASAAGSGQNSARGQAIGRSQRNLKAASAADIIVLDVVDIDVGGGYHSQRSQDGAPGVFTAGSAGSYLSEASMASHHDRLTFLEATIQRLERATGGLVQVEKPAPRPSPGTGEEVDDGMGPLTRTSSQASFLSVSGHIEFAESSDLVYDIQESIWDAVMLVFYDCPNGLRISGITDKMALVFTYLANLGMQLTLIASIYLGMLENPYPMDVVEDMQAYRDKNEIRAVPASNITGRLVSATGKITGGVLGLCERNLWSWEQDQYDDLFEYTRPSFDFAADEIPGYWLAFLGMSVWVCCIFSDYEANSMQLRGIIAVPSKKTSKVVHDGKQLKIDGVTPIKRFLLIVLVVLPRIFVSMTLLYVGLKYIAHTFQFSDIVLNCVALMFVLDMDETLFAVLCPMAIRKAVVRLESIPVARITIAGDVELADAIRWMWMTVALVASKKIWLEPFKAGLVNAVEFLCPNAGNMAD